MSKAKANPQLAGYRREKIGDDKEARAEAENRQIAKAEAEETAEPELRPDPSVQVPTGDETQPMPQPEHRSALNTLYEKSRKNRELVTREDEEGSPDVARIRALQSEAAGGQPQEEFDTNRPDRFSTPEEIQAYEERVAQEDGADDPEEPDSAKSDISEPRREQRSYEDVDTDVRVSVKVDGQFYDVPQQDIDDAGGIENYQKNRAATIRLQRAATLERKAQERALQMQQVPVTPPEELTDPPEGGQSEADDVDSLRREMMDVVIDGDESQINEWIVNRLQRKREAAAPTPKPQTRRTTTERAEPPIEQSEIQQELKRQYDEDIEATNAMMNEEFPDIMEGAKPNASELQRRRLADAQEYFRVLTMDPHNVGRTQKEMAREAARRARKIVYPEEHRGPMPRIEEERQQRVQRKRRLPQPSRADRTAPAQPKQDQPTVATAREHLQRLRRHAGLDLGEEDLARTRR